MIETKITKTMNPDLQEVVKKVRALRELTQTTGFKTSRSVSELLSRLNADDLASVCLQLQQ